MIPSAVFIINSQEMFSVRGRRRLDDDEGEKSKAEEGVARAKE
jgi:hypothetical protein